MVLSGLKFFLLRNFKKPVPGKKLRNPGSFAWKVKIIRFRMVM